MQHASIHLLLAWCIICFSGLTADYLWHQERSQSKGAREGKVGHSTHHACVELRAVCLGLGNVSLQVGEVHGHTHSIETCSSQLSTPAAAAAAAAAVVAEIHHHWWVPVAPVLTSLYCSSVYKGEGPSCRKGTSEASSPIVHC
jgi:hypothetical protein